MEDMDLLMGRIAVICRVVALPNDLSDTPRDKIKMGKTKVQKILYFLQEGLNLPLEYSFKMRYYAPYSEQIDSRLSLAKAMGYVDIDLSPDGFEYDVRLKNSHVDDSEHSLHLDDDVDDTIRRLADLPLIELELWATVHFIQSIRPKWDREKVADTTRRLKPRFTADDVLSVYQKLQDTGLLHVPSDSARQN